TFNSAANTSFRIEFFASQTADPSGFGEGERYLGFLTFTTDAAGNVSGGFTFAATVTAGERITSTATNLTTNDTSEFSAAVIANAPGVTVTPVSGLTTTESGGIASFQVVLDAIPISDVTITVASSNTSEGTISTGSLTFTSSNWNIAQTVTLTGVQDFVTDGDTAYMTNLGASSSSDAMYNGVNPADVSLINLEGVNNAPINTTPPGQTTNQTAPIVFSVVNGNAISVGDVDATNLQVTLSTAGGTLTLAQTTGLVFSTGSGVDDASMTFFGSIADINAALNGLRFVPGVGSGTLTALTVITNDLGASGTGGARSSASNVLIGVDQVFGPFTPGGSTLGGEFAGSEQSSSANDWTQNIYGIGAPSEAFAPQATSSSSSSEGLSDSLLSDDVLSTNRAVLSPLRASIDARSNEASGNVLSRFNDIDQTIQSLLRRFGQSVVVTPLSGNTGDGFETGQALVDNNKLTGFGRLSKESIEVAGAVVSLGTVWFIARSSLLVASLAAGVPAWRRLDPLPILPRSQDEGETDAPREEQDMADHLFGYEQKPSIDHREEEQR
ncbi:MAG TPA: hypothetical protein VM532_04155, partial [Burkholderiales bacterium]|nr:hypothetical protein [Burkholderiales bacterium]